MKSTQTKIIITSSVFTIIVGALIFFGVYPEMTKYSDNKSKLSETKAKVEEAEFKLSELNKLNNKSAEIEETKEFVTGLLPDDKSNSDFVVKAEAMSDGISVIINTLTTGTSTTSANKSPASSSEKKSVDNSVEFSIATISSYPTILDIIGKLESFPRFNIIDSLYISGRDKDLNIFNFRANGRIFYGK